MIQVMNPINEHVIDKDIFMVGLSTDIKPVDKIPGMERKLITGAVFLEQDTSKVYMFNEEDSSWRSI